MTHTLNTIKKHILGPYLIKGINGEVFVLNNISELYNTLPAFIINERFNFNGFINNNKEYDTFYNKPNILYNLKVDIDYCSNNMISLLSVLNSYIMRSSFIYNKDAFDKIPCYKTLKGSFFTITHMIYPDLLEGLSEDKIHRLIAFKRRNSLVFNIYFKYERYYLQRLGFKINNSSYFRRPKTLNEIKKNEIDIKEYGETLVRGKRRNIPNAWDDISKGQPRLGRSWKQKKIKKQWMKHL